MRIVLLAVLLVGAAHDGRPLGFANLPQLVAAHPLHAVLETYTREIAALRGTQSVSGLDDPAARARVDAAALRAGAQAAQARAQQLATAGTATDRAQESAALSEIIALRGAGARDASAYGEQLGREVAASLAAYRDSTAQRTRRALEARRQQLHEQELTLAYDLARRDASARLNLRLRLGELHLNAADHATLQSQLAALDRHESATIAASRRDDAAILSNYSAELSRTAAVLDAQMAAELRVKAEANDAIRRRALEAESRAAAAVPYAAAQLSLFASSYRSEADARAIASGFGAAGSDLSRRFTQLGDADARSRAATAAQIRTLEGDRSALYSAIVRQIVRTANRIARDRRLGSVAVAQSQPKGSVDLTPAVRAEIARGSL